MNKLTAYILVAAAIIGIVFTATNTAKTLQKEVQQRQQMLAYEKFLLI